MAKGGCLSLRLCRRLLRARRSSSRDFSSPQRAARAVTARVLPRGGAAAAAPPLAKRLTERAPPGRGLARGPTALLFFSPRGAPGPKSWISAPRISAAASTASASTAYDTTAVVTAACDSEGEGGRITTGPPLGENGAGVCFAGYGEQLPGASVDLVLR